MSVSFDQAASLLTGPGQPFETIDADVLGTTQPVFKNAPANLRDLFMVTRSHGDKTSVVYEDERYSFADVMREADALGAALLGRYGVSKGDRVAIAMRNYPEWVTSFIAVTSIGAISVSLNSWWTADELAFALEDSAPTVLIADDQRTTLASAACHRLGTRMVGVRMTGAAALGVDRWEDVVVAGTPLPHVEIEPDDDATILYTSGTTGKPKGAVSTHRAVISAVTAFAARQAVEAGRAAPAGGAQAAPADELQPAFILIVPLFHVTGCVAVMLSCLVGGAKLVMMYKWDVDKALKLIQREQVTNFVGVPTQSWDLVHSPRFAEFDTSTLKTIGGGGAPAPPAQVELVAAKFPKGGPNIGYGMTETNAYGPQNLGADYIAHPSSTGRIVPPMRIEARDSQGDAVPRGERGELWFSGPNLIRGFWNRPDATAETIVDGWLRSGDLGYIDAEGFVFIVDRVKDMILRGGENVYCAEVEAAIYEHPDIHEAAVYGIPHERLGEEVAATVLLQPGSTLTEDDLRTYLSSKLASYKIPTHIVITEEPLPRNAAGKFLKRELRDRSTHA